MTLSLSPPFTVHGGLLTGVVAALLATGFVRHMPPADLPATERSTIELSTTEPSATNRYRTGETYLDVAVLSTDLQARTATLSIRWDASWRDAESWDAAWILLKGRTDGTWTPLRVRDQPVATGSPTPRVDVPADRSGLVVRRDAPGQGDNRWRVQVAWASDHDSEAIQTVRAFGVEMVYVGEGAFDLGTAGSPTERTTPGDWLRGSSPAPISALFRMDEDAPDAYGGTYRVESEAAIPVGEATGDLMYVEPDFLEDYSTGDKNGPLPDAFPKGFSSFLQMKYEVTEQQYVDFLNALRPEQARARHPASLASRDASTSRFRHTIALENGRYRTERPYRACTFLSWNDALAWADWMHLRPMTELEFEKSARGPEPAVFREFAWGANEQTGPFRRTNTLLDASGQPANTADDVARADGNIHIQMLPPDGFDTMCNPDTEPYLPNYPACRSLSGGDSGHGPLRVGIHGAGSGGNRVRAGASFYGAMDLSGNAVEQVISIGWPDGRGFAGSHGDGRLSPDGSATNQDWNVSPDSRAFSTRGSGWAGHPNHGRVADRFFRPPPSADSRSATTGFRGVRSGMNLQD